MNVSDFAELQSHYTGASNKRKWIILYPEILLNYLKECNYKPHILKKKLNISYATLKRFLVKANLWHLAQIRNTPWKSGRKRYATHDKFGYEYADSKYDYLSDTGEIIRRFKHQVIAEEIIGRLLKDCEVVHHIDLNKKNNSPDNLFICNDNSHHRLLHGNLEVIAGQLVRLGIIKFHPDHGYYHNNEIGFTEE